MRNLLSLSLIALAMLSISATARAEATEHATSCAYCTSAYQFGVYGVAALEAKQASKPFYLRHSIKPITVHNPSTRRSARVTVNLATTTITLGALSIGVPNLGRVGFVLDFSDGSGSLTSSVDLSVIDRTIQAHNPVTVDCLKSKCSNYRKAFGSAGAPAPRRGSVSEGAYDTDAFWRSGNPHRLFYNTQRSAPRRTIVRTESCGLERCPSWDEPPELVRNGVLSWYVDWQPPRDRETRIITEEIRGGGGRSRSTRTNSTGLGLGTGDNAGKAKEH